MNPALATVAKILKSVQKLRFANRRTFDIQADAAWLARSKLTPTEKRQLVAILGFYDPKPAITLERALTTAPSELFSGGLDAFAECPIEWFDVQDQADVAQFQLWLYYGDGGILFKAATTTPVAQINNSSFYGTERGLDEATGERLAALLRQAKKIAAKLYPGSELASVDF
jgi:predicted membrane-bound mannosyltransferase